jgi:hypothetical protein
MKGFELTPKQVAELRITHRKEREKRNAYKINAVILLDNWYNTICGIFQIINLASNYNR